MGLGLKSEGCGLRVAGPTPYSMQLKHQTTQHKLGILNDINFGPFQTPRKICLIFPLKATVCPQLTQAFFLCPFNTAKKVHEIIGFPERDMQGPSNLTPKPQEQNPQKRLDP